MKARLAAIGRAIAGALASFDQRFLSTTARAQAFVVALFAITYTLTLHPGAGGTLNMGDSAKFQFLGSIYGLGHPPGNPLYLLAATAMAKLPLPASAAWKGNFLSAIFGIGTLAFVFRTMLALTTRPKRDPDDDASEWKLGPIRLAVLVTVLVGLGPLFWTLSTEAEVYTLSTLFVSCATWGVVRFVVRGDERALAIGMFAWLAGFGNHLSIVALAPAMAWVLIGGVRKMKHKARTLAAILLGAAIGAGSYAYVWHRASATMEYTEFIGPLDRAHFWDYITAKIYQKEIGNFGLWDAVYARLPSFVTQIQKQWMWPLLLVVPFGLVRLHRASAPLLRVLTLMALAQITFGFVYPIPDPEGFYLPLLPTIAIILACGIEWLAAAGNAAKKERWHIVALSLAAVVFVAFGAVHVTFFVREPTCEMWMGTRDNTIEIIYPSLFEAMPESSSFAVPCGHYGCVEVTNYFRLADATVKRKNIKFVRFPWSEWDDNLAPVQTVTAAEALSRPVCTVLPFDMKQLEANGVKTKTILRDAWRFHGRRWKPAPIACTGYGSAPIPPPK